MGRRPSRGAAEAALLLVRLGQWSIGHAPYRGRVAVWSGLLHSLAYCRHLPPCMMHVAMHAPMHGGGTAWIAWRWQKGPASSRGLASKTGKRCVRVHACMHACSNYLG